MWLLIKKVLLTGMVLWLATPALGEYYKYTDHNGVLRFTDDLASVPQDQRPDVRTYESVKSSPVQRATGSPLETKEILSSSPVENETPPSAGTWKETIFRQANELDQMQVELNKTFLELQGERTVLKAQAPVQGAPVTASTAYRKQVDALNAKIERYEKQQAEYKEKVKAYNLKFGK